MTTAGLEEDAQGMLETFVNETSGEWSGPPAYHGGSYVYPAETTNGRADLSLPGQAILNRIRLRRLIKGPTSRRRGPLSLCLPVRRDASLRLHGTLVQLEEDDSHVAGQSDNREFPYSYQSDKEKPGRGNKMESGDVNLNARLTSELRFTLPGGKNNTFDPA
ncbi:hypothetical protein WN48_04943 [Eufriesea mexicana]|uniref:Uncharacterized protein n=1 Tax=Eufriesea mexicana TaxID=516756 RepID=A0A310SI40_9HYME|nr:hypothetical protein WN48_04943 [Eufriesea mexicana]